MPKAAPLGPVGLVEAYSKNVLRRQQQSGGRAHHRPLAPLILLLHLLVGTVGRGNVAQGASAASQAPVAVLLAFKASIARFDQALRSDSAAWTADSAPCSALGPSWQHVLCTDGEVTGLSFHDVPLAGTIQESWGSMLSNLTVLELSNCSLRGTLPASFGRTFQSMTDLDLSGNRIAGSLPLDWASQGAFPVLQSLRLDSNAITGYFSNWSDAAMDGGLNSIRLLNLTRNRLGGSLPSGLGQAFPAAQELYLGSNMLTGSIAEEWGSRGSLQELQIMQLDNNAQLGSTLPQWSAAGALPSLQLLSVRSCGLNGTLPASWGRSLRNLSSIILDGNHITGTMPVEWAELDMQQLVLANNIISGTLPAAYGAAGNWPKLRLLDLSYNYFRGVLPREWGEQGGMGQLGPYGLQLTANGLSGHIPPEYALPDRFSGAIIYPGNPSLCGSAPEDFTIYGDYSADMDHYSDEHFQPTDVFGLLVQNEVACNSLLAFWAFVVHSWQGGKNDAFTPGWTYRSPLGICEGWQGVGCNAAGEIVSIQVPDFLWNGLLLENTGVWSSLRLLDISSNNFSGSLPSSIALEMPSLTVMNLSRNAFVGTIPAAWGENGSFPDMASLDVSINPFDEWHLDNLLGNYAMPELQILAAAHSNLTGTLPVELVDWEELVELNLTGNHLTGPLPESLGAAGAWPALASLDLSSNALSGLLPAHWGEGDALMHLAMLDLSENVFSGSVPDWSAGGRMPNLKYLFLLPGNIGLCGSTPPQMIIRDKSNPSLTNITLPSCASLAGSSHSRKMLTGASITGLVVGLVTALTVLAMTALLIWQRHARRKMLKASSSSSSDAKALDVLLGNASGSLGRDSNTLWEMLGRLTQQDAFPDAFPNTPFDWRIEPARLSIIASDEGALKPLGAGAFGTVFLAKLDNVSDVAVKVLHKPGGSAYDPQDLRRFADEVSLIRESRDANIVAFRGAWLSQDIIFMVQEFMENGDLYRAIARDRDNQALTWYAKGRGIALDIARGLFYLHSNGWVHMDLKSPNILLSRDYTAKIADVGLAKSLLTRSHVSVTQAGTWDWQAPEVLLGQPAGFPADTFSYGVVLTEIVCGSHQERGKYDAPDCPAQCPEEIGQLVAACMDSAPCCRPTAKDIVLKIASLPT